MMRPIYTLLMAGLLAGCAAAADDSAVGVPQGPVQRCMNLGGALEAPVEGEWGPKIERADMVAIAAQGFDSVRLPIAWSAHVDAANRIDPAFFARVDAVVRWGLEAGLVVVVDVHHYWELAEDADTHVPRLLDLWDQIAAHYAGWPQGLVFEPVNEPSESFSQDKVNAFNREVLRRIRVDHPDRWVVLGGGAWGSVEPMRDGTMEVPADWGVVDDRVVMTFHSYAPFAYTHQGAAFMDVPPPAGRRLRISDLAAFADEARVGAAFARAHAVPVLMGEFGTYRDTIPQTERAAWTAGARRSLEANGLGWCYFDWQTSFAYADADSHVPLPGMGDALFGR